MPDNSGKLTERKSTETNIARLFCVGLSGLTLTDDDKRVLERQIGGVVLFARNFQSRDQVAALLESARHFAGPDLLACVDQEGGSVVRLTAGFTAIPSMRDLGRDGSNQNDLAIEVGACLGNELRTAGFDIDFAPVLDVDSNPANPVIGERSIGRNPETVARLGQQIIMGLNSQGIIACGKHFPGHGDTAQDSHHELPRLAHDEDRLKEVELKPFQHAIDQYGSRNDGGMAIMSAHVVFESIHANQPGTLCPEVMTGLLRNTMGFDGLCISDCLEMKAIADGIDWGGTVGAAVACLKAGIDMPLICHTPSTMLAAIDATEKAVRSGELSPERISSAHARIEKARQFRRAARGQSYEFSPSDEFQAFIAAHQPSGSDPTQQVAYDG